MNSHPANPAAPQITWATPASIVYGTALSSTQLNATANVGGTFAYSPIAGTVLSAGAQTLSVSFTPTDATDYAQATDEVTLTVTKATPQITWATPASIVYGAALSSTQLNATANVGGTFAYSPIAGTVLNAGAQTLSVSFTPTDATDYAQASAGVTLAVAQALPEITWQPAGAIAEGMPLTSTQLDATATAPGSTAQLAGSFLYDPGAGSILTSSGKQTLRAEFTPANAQNYSEAEASASLTVAPFELAAWGDSLTVGNDGVSDQGRYPAELQNLIILPVVSLGVGGQTSTQIGVREGGIPTYVTVAGGSIPAAGGVPVTFPAGYEPMNSQGPSNGVTGSIDGVHGTVTFASGIYTFTPTTPGSAVSVAGAPQFVVDTPYSTSFAVFWEGRNNFAAESQVISDLAAQAATAPSGQNYLVLSVINMNTPGEWQGGAQYQQIVALNNQMKNTFGSHYLDVRGLLVSSYDSTRITDISDYNHDEVPTSLRAVNGIGTLASSVGAADTSFTLNMTTGNLPSGGILTVDSGPNAENVLVTGVAGATVTVTRNFGGVNTAHAAGAPITVTDQIHLNAQGYQIIANAVAQYLSEYEVPAL